MTITRHEPSQVYSKAVEAAGLVFTAGIVATKLDADVKGQTEEVLAEIDRLLALAGSDKTKILKAQIWLADISTFAEMNAVWDKWIDGKDAPARATGEAKLATPDYKVEIIIVAAR